MCKVAVKCLHECQSNVGLISLQHTSQTRTIGRLKQLKQNPVGNVSAVVGSALRSARFCTSETIYAQYYQVVITVQLLSLCFIYFPVKIAVSPGVKWVAVLLICSVAAQTEVCSDALLWCEQRKMSLDFYFAAAYSEWVQKMSNDHN